MRISARIFLPLVGAALCLARPAGGADADKFIPADADVVVSINVRQLVDSPAFQKYGKADAIQGLQDPQIQMLLAALGLDPLKDVDRLLLTSSGDMDNPRVLLAVRGTFDVNKIGAAARLYAKINPAELKITQANDLTIYEGTKAGKTVYAHLLADGSALLASTDRDYLTDAVQTPSPGPSQAMKNALAKVPGDAPIWVAAVVTDAMRSRLSSASQLAKKLAPKLEVVTASVSVTKEVVTRVVVYTSDAAGANDAKGMLDQSKDVVLGLSAFQPGPFSTLLHDLHDNIDVSKDRNSVQITIRLTEDLLEKADKLKSAAKDKPDK